MYQQLASFLNIYQVQALLQSQTRVIILITSQILLPNKVQCPDGGEYTKNNPAKGRVSQSKCFTGALCSHAIIDL